MDDKVNEYQVLLASYKWMLTQQALNRSINIQQMRLIKLRLEQLKKDIENQATFIHDK